MAELGQLLFGNKFEDYHCPDHIADDLIDLSKALSNLVPYNQAHGVLGGEFGYGNDFANDVFEMFPYYWGDCECSFGELEYQWCQENDHELHCYQVELKQRFEDHGLEEFGFPHKMKYEKAEELREKVYQELLTKHNLPRQGRAVHCTCDLENKWQQFIENNQHDPRCGVIRPNFHHFASGVMIYWYKYIGRSMTINCAISKQQWRQIYDECMQSLGSY